MSIADQVEVNLFPIAACPRQKMRISGIDCSICQIPHVTGSAAVNFFFDRGKGCVVQVRCNGHLLIGSEPVRMKLTISELPDRLLSAKSKRQKAALRLVEAGARRRGSPLDKITTQILGTALSHSTVWSSACRGETCRRP